MIEFELTDHQTSPPGGFYFRQKESGMEFRHYSRDAFFKEIQGHRLANGYPIEPDWKREIEDSLCCQHPEWVAEGICRRAGVIPLERRPVSFAAMQSFLNVVISWLHTVVSGGDPFVDQHEADRRAAICASCPFNVQLGFSCGACADTLFRMLSKVFQTPHKTSYDDHLSACGICSCTLKVAVWIPLEVQRKGLSEELQTNFKAISWCWKKES